MSTTMKAVVIAPLSPQWHIWRSAGIGGSDAPVIAAAAGLCKPAPWMKSIDELWKIKTGRISDLNGSTWATRRGVAAEPLARSAYERATGVLLSPIYGEMAHLPFIRSSFDGVDFDGNVIGEAKLGSSHVHALAKENEVVEYYKPQLAHQALTAWGMPDEWLPEHTVSFISYDPNIKEMLHVTKPAFEYRKLAEDLLVAEQDFWNKVLADTQPCGEDWKAAASEYVLLRAQIDALVTKEEAVKNRLIGLLGSATKISAAGVSVTRQERKGAVNYDKLLADHIKLTEDELSAYRKVGAIDYDKLLTEQTKLTEAEIEAYRKDPTKSIVVRVLS